MAQNFRSELLENEKRRRDEVIAAAERRQRGAGDKLRQLYGDGTVATYCALAAVNDPVLGKYPLLSADYQHWREDREAWISALGTVDGFHWPEPACLGAPYSRAFLEEFYRETEEEKKKREEERARYAKKFNFSLPAPRDQAKAADPDNADDDDDDREIPSRWLDDNGVWRPADHSDLDEAIVVWKELFGRLWIEGFLPFEVPVPTHMDTTALLAAPEDLEGFMLDLWRTSSPHAPWCLRLFARVKKDASARLGVRMSVYVDWPPTQDTTNEMWRHIAYYTTMTLFQWYHGVLRENQVNLRDFMRGQRAKEFQQHQTLLQEIQVVSGMIDEQNAQIEGSGAADRALCRKQRKTIGAVALANVKRRMASTDDRDKQLELLAKVVESGLSPLPLSIDDRRLAVSAAAKTVLAGMAGAALNAADNVQAKMRNVGRFLRVDGGDAWEKVLPIATRLRIIRDLVRQGAPEHRDQLEAFLGIWSSKEQVLWYSDDLDDAARRLEQTHLDDAVNRFL
ncbi:hypothetical protein F5X98DRAFT_389335 [Xylaria grammica]|nr:hypothetical protein F5X98DRAFT_389335 [Xylaria grammica]